MRVHEIISEEPAGNLAGDVFNPRNPQTFPQPRNVRVPRNDATPKNPVISPTSGVIMRKDPMIQAPLDPMFESTEEFDLSKVHDQTFHRLLRRGHRLDRLEELPATSFRPTQYRALLAPTVGTPYVSRRAWEPDQTERYQYHDPELSDLVTHDFNEPYLEHTMAHLKPGLLQEIPDLGPGFMYRGGSQEEFDEFRRIGQIVSTGDYNIGDQQKGLTYWSTEASQAASYSNSFAPNGYKATFEHPAYVWVARMPGRRDIQHVKGTGENEIGVKRPITANEITQIWRGRVYDYAPGDLQLVPHDYIEKTYKIGSAAMPFGRVAWERIA